MPEQKHIIWSNIDLDLDDWYDDLHEEYRLFLLHERKRDRQTSEKAC